MPAYGFGFGIEDQNGKFLVKGQQKEAGGYGKSLKEDYRFFYGAGVGMAHQHVSRALDDCCW